MIFLEDGDAASSADLVMLCAAVFIGQSEGRLMTAGKIADYIGMPRPSTIRKLQALRKRGVVVRESTGGWRIATERSEIAARVDAAISENARQILRSASILSRMDSVAIERRKVGA